MHTHCLVALQEPCCEQFSGFGGVSQRGTLQVIPPQDVEQVQTFGLVQVPCPEQTDEFDDEMPKQELPEHVDPEKPEVQVH